MEKRYPLGIQNFEKLRSEGYCYVDKTALIHQIVTTGSYYFLCRPRRFGKSLLLSTLEAYFQGKQDLFKGLAIDRLENRWESYPILHIDLNAEKYDCEESLDNILNDYLCRWEIEYAVDRISPSPSLRFANIIRTIYRKTAKRVVILVDEYDKPLLQAIGNTTLQDKFRNTLKPFYGVLKSQDGCIRFAFLTGVTKFGKVSVFSDLNNLRDLSMLPAYSGLCGITESELASDMKEDMHRLGQATGLTEDEVYREIKRRYDGYHFAVGAEDVYNPYSLFNTFANQAFGNYWFETGTPSYLATLLKQHHYDLSRLGTEEINAEALNGIDTSDTDPIPVIFQSGYLTIKSFNAEFGYYTLGFPNQEVEESFMKYLMPYYANVPATRSSFEIGQFAREVRDGDYDAFFERLRSLLADIPYEMIVGHSAHSGIQKNGKTTLPEKQLEAHYQNVLFLIFKLMGFYTHVEYHTSRGRIDLLVVTGRFCYVMEFKLNGTAEDALKQINAKDYALPFRHTGKQVIKIGVNFSSKTRNIEKWLVEQM